MPKGTDGAAQEIELVERGGPAALYVLQQLNAAHDYYADASRAARGASVGYVRLAQVCYVLSGLILAATIVGALERVVSVAPIALSDLIAFTGLPLSATKWSVGILSAGYLLSQYGQRRGFTRAWTRYAETAEAIRGLRREFVLQGSSEDAQARQVACARAVEKLNALLLEETQRWARDLMIDFDRVHALLQEGAQPMRARQHGSARNSEVGAG